MIKTIIIRAIVAICIIFTALLIYSMEMEEKEKPFRKLTIVEKILRIFYDLFCIFLLILVIGVCVFVICFIFMAIIKKFWSIF